MAQRLATEYVNATLTLSEVQMNQFLRAAEDPLVHSRIKVLDNGGHEIVLEDVTGEEVHLPFDRRKGMYVCELTCRLVNQPLTNMIRKLFLRFKGEGIVNRVYHGFTMIYTYNQGSVRRIVEKTDGGCRLVFEYKNTVQELQHKFLARDVEREISRVYNEINDLLDQRIRIRDKKRIGDIDQRLRSLSNILFTLEA
ncbi:non-ribosomal peptide synthetase module [Paenibacillus sp. P96]|uniref:Non-ribosomal peptide synthetase module n=1 Tax=Paenibacillus zeirhizosphaerae TaxID=2987519 RepID=A0ABT9FMP7_9BACL|nr:non-ribosomal peptide synthetase module [Paenibacillus sp. P96]MDP4095682.1 non-ribosomal peptide synthetase module [Paenibacillus sp. P96]